MPACVWEGGGGGRGGRVALVGVLNFYDFIHSAVGQGFQFLA